MDTDIYYKDGVAVLTELLKDAFGDYFKAYFGGEPEELPESLLPCVMVTEQTGSISAGATMTDDITETIQIIIALNKKDDVGTFDSNNLTQTKLRRLVKGQEATTGQYLPNTVMYVLRKHLTLDNIAVSNQIETDFDVAQRGEDTFTQEAYITIRLERMAIVPARD